ncbi:helix-turn-helix transcriptional regulator [Robiginitalea sp. IMCC44478]|uniref:helix-turn-helix transcriptional regulator n=1 Tax=Robiginitalea sp. IMCC44478 TaxID=3459122 RepID=UPI004041684B
MNFLRLIILATFFAVSPLVLRHEIPYFQDLSISDGLALHQVGWNFQESCKLSGKQPGSITGTNIENLENKITWPEVPAFGRRPFLKNTAGFHSIAANTFNMSGPNTLLYLLILALFIAVVFVTYQGNLWRKRRNKDGVERKAEIKIFQKFKDKINAENLKLSKEVGNKNKELAAMTLMLVRKNELLGRVKKELRSLPGAPEQIKSIIRQIDRDLNQSDDWELFKEAFNNADQKFLKKLKKAHPNLTPNDIRLCAYLRLNLASKEIAPLFNISVRSLEIKRYRLRKKMNLSPEDNLVKYILDL